MNYAIILSGGTGTRLGGEIPKQYIEVGDKPIILYCAETMEKTDCIDQICIVAAPQWQETIRGWIEKAPITKFQGFADAGESRQHSLISGLKFIAESNPEEGSKVLIHDATRPNVSKALLTRCMERLADADGVLPVIPVKDTMYLSEDKKTISGLLNRDQIFSGQAPESFDFAKYYKINSELTDEEISNVRGTAEIAYRKGLSVALTEGEEINYKITTAADLEKFRDQIERKNETT